jgi:DNA-binding winged helix-turn-helix (wHTH) protein
MALEFGDFVMDERSYELRRRNDLIKLEPKVFDVLAWLVRHRDRVVISTRMSK